MRSPGNKIPGWSNRCESSKVFGNNLVSPLHKWRGAGGEAPPGNNILFPKTFGDLHGMIVMDKTGHRSWGEINRHVSPRTIRAKVKIAIAPSAELEIIDGLAPDKSRLLKDAECFDAVVYGVLDVMMTALPSPIKSFRLTILDALYDDIHSSPMAFRLAAREAAKSILSEG